MRKIIQAYEIISILGIVQGIFLSVLLLLKKKNKTANYFLSALIALVAFILLYNLLVSNGIFTEYYSLSVFVNTIVFLFPTLHWLYAVFLLGPSKKIVFKNLSYFSAFAIVNVMSIPVYLKNQSAIYIYGWIFDNNINNLISAIYSIIVMFYVLKLLKDYSTKIKMNFSSIEKINLNWLKAITIIIIIFDFFLILLLYLPGWLKFDSSVPNIMLIILTVSLIYITAIFGFRQPEIYQVNDLPADTVKYKTSGLSEEKAIEIEQKLNEFFKDNKPFLDDNLNINDLSDRLNITPAYLSQVLNERLGINFYTLINKYRIEEAKKLIIDHEYSNMKLEVIAYEVGFNSKSTFNAAFKKFTGMTPSQFRTQTKEIN